MQSKGQKMKKSVVNLQSKTVGDIDLDSDYFWYKRTSDLIHQYIRYQNAKSRQGPHKKSLDLK